MTAPADPILAAGGRTVTVGRAPALLTEYAPVTVINTSISDRVWLAASSSVSAGSGVPLDPGTSFAWSTPGPLYAILDDAAAADVAVIITGSGTDWSPSPAAIGGAVAAELTTQGVPSKLLITDLGTHTISDWDTLGIDYSLYASIYVNLIDLGGNVALLMEWADETGTTHEPYYQLTDVQGITLPVTDSMLWLYPENQKPLTVQIIGYNRSVSANPAGNRISLSGRYMAVTIPTSGAAVNLADIDTQGPASLAVLATYGDNNIVPLTLYVTTYSAETDGAVPYPLLYPIPLRWIAGNVFGYNGTVAMPIVKSSLSVGVSANTGDASLTSTVLFEATLSALVGT